MPTTLITGASSGIGWELARLAAQERHRVIVSARAGERLERAAARLRKEGAEVVAVAADLGRPDGAEQLHRAVNEQGLQVDHLINNAGYGSYGPFLEQDLANQMGMLQVNIAALTELTYRFGREMAERRSGRIMNVASTAAFQPGPLFAVYFATKAYVLSLSEALANEFAEHNVTVTALCPGPTKTEFAERAQLGRSKLFENGAMDAETVARQGFEAMMEGKTLLINGLRNSLLARSVSLLPRSVVPGIVRQIQEQRR